MTGPAASPRSAKGAHPPTLAQRNFPRRVRAVLEGVLEFTSGVLDQGLQMMLDETEQHLFKLAEQARSNQVQKQCFEALREGQEPAEWTTKPAGPVEEEATPSATLPGGAFAFPITQGGVEDVQRVLAMTPEEIDSLFKR